MSKGQRGLLTAAVLSGLMLGLSGLAQAALMDRGSFTYVDGVGNTGSVNLIYDVDLDLTWVGDTTLVLTSGFPSLNGTLRWQQAQDWAADLTIGNFTDWRLPSALNQNGSGPCITAPAVNCTGSELGHLFYNELGGNAGESVLTQTGDTQQEMENFSLFSNIRSEEYWSGTEFATNTSNAWFFSFNNGDQHLFNKNARIFPWAVRSGDVAAVPAPSAMLLMGSGLVGLLTWRCYRRV